MSDSRPAALALVAGLGAGVVLMLAFWAAVRPSATEPPAVTTTPVEAVTTTTTAPAWASVHETRLGPSVLVPVSVEVVGGRLVLGYDITNITPTDDADGASFGLAAPDRWTLVTTDGEVAAESVGPSSRAVRFTVPDDFTTDQIVEVRVESYRVASPVTWPLPLSGSDGLPVAVGPELEFRLVQVIEQSENWLVIVEVDVEGPLIDFTVDGEGRDWASSSISMLGSPRWTLDFRGEDLPDPLPLVVRGVAWVEIERTAVVDLAGVV